MDTGIKTIKCKFKSIKRKDILYSDIEDCVKRTNYIVFMGSHFLRAYILYCFNEELEIPKINSHFIRICFKLLLKSSCGPKGKTDEQLEKFYKKFTKDTNLRFKLNGINLSYILKREYECLEVAYSNNILNNIQKYMRQYVNEIFNIPKIKRKTKEEFLKLSKEEQIEYKINLNEQYKNRKLLLKEIAPIKSDIMDETLNSDEKYHKFIKDFRDNVLPTKTTENLLDDIKNYPLNYLKSMLIMNKILEEKERKLFQPLPLRTSITDKYIHLDTGAIRDIFSCTLKDKSSVWEEYFNLHKFKLKGYRFNNLISTDGTSVSISFMKTELFMKKELTATKMTKASKLGKKQIMGLTDEEKIKLKTEKELKQNKLKLDKIRQSKEKQKASRLKFKELNEEQRNEIKQKIYMKRNNFSYIEDLVKIPNKRKELDERKIHMVLGDPGIRDLLTLMGINGKRFNYSKARRLKELKRKKYNKLQKNQFTKLIKNSKNADNTLNDLTNLNCKTNNYGKFIKYIKSKLQFNESIKNNIEEYKKYVNKLKWFSYINKRRHEDKLLNELKEMFGKDAIFIIGDWSNKSSNIKGSTMPNMGLRKLLSRVFEVYTIDEFNTSKINCYTGEVNEKLKLPVSTVNDKGETIQKITEMYSVFTYKMGNKMGCINRDYNAVRNMKLIVESLLETKERPEKFKYKKSKDQLTNKMVK